jgi:hypothetical protein
LKIPGLEPRSEAFTELRELIPFNLIVSREGVSKRVDLGSGRIGINAEDFEWRHRAGQSLEDLSFSLSEQYQGGGKHGGVARDLRLNRKTRDDLTRHRGLVGCGDGAYRRDDIGGRGPKPSAIGNIRVQGKAPTTVATLEPLERGSDRPHSFRSGRIYSAYHRDFGVSGGHESRL